MQIGREILYLSRADVERVGLSMRETIDILERAHTCKGEGRVCMGNWVQTLERYRRGIDQVIVHLQEAIDDQPATAGGAVREPSSCCCRKTAPAKEG